jgi:hypothetical protein
MSLAEFLLARIAEDEADARDAFYDGQRWVPEEEAVVAADKDLDAVLFLDRKRDATHAANWSPARVLAECEAKRRIVELHSGQHECVGEKYGDPHACIMVADWSVYALDPTLLLLALPYADHESYQPEWRV